MTNKKFKLTAAAVALAACAAAQPVSASAAAETPELVPENDAVVQPEEKETTAPAKKAADADPAVEKSGTTEVAQTPLPVLGPKDTIAYPPAETVQNPDGSTTETTEGPVTDGETGKDEYNLSSRTNGGRLVHLAGDKSLIGQFIDVKITSGNTWALYGEIV